MPLKHPFFNGCLHEFTRAVKTKLAAKWYFEDDEVPLSFVTHRPAALLVSALVERFNIEPYSDFSAK